MRTRGRAAAGADVAGPGKDGGAAARRFPCTSGGAIRRGRRRLAALLLGLSLLLVAVAAAAWWSGRRWPALLALLVALVPWTAWRMSGDLDPLWLEVEGPWLTLQEQLWGDRDPRLAILTAH